MKIVLRTAALVIALLAAGVWWATGAHRGWTQTSVTLMEVEPVTGLEHPVRHERFVMGVELLGAGLAAAAVLAGVSFFFNPKSNKHIKTEPSPQ